MNADADADAHVAKRETFMAGQGIPHVRDPKAWG
jgi:hypothetical protein